MFGEDGYRVPINHQQYGFHRGQRPAHTNVKKVTMKAKYVLREMPAFFRDPRCFLRGVIPGLWCFRFFLVFCPIYKVEHC